MWRLIKLSAIATALVVLTGAARTQTERELILIRSSDVTARAETDTSIGQYYTLSYQLPTDLPSERLDQAILELDVDVRAKSRDEYVNEAPVLQVYALHEPYTGVVEASSLDTLTYATRPVALGNNRRVLLDITRIVRAHLTGALDNNGLILGSLTGMREGDFSLVSGRLATDAVGQVRIYTRAASGR